MAEFIPEIAWTEFKKLKPEQLRKMKSCEVYFNCEYQFTFVNGHTEPAGFLRKMTEHHCLTANAVGGKTIEEILEAQVAPV